MTGPDQGGTTASRHDPGAELACIDVVEIVTDYLEGVLSASVQTRVDRHLGGCVGCTTYVDQMRMTIAIAGRMRAVRL